MLKMPRLGGAAQLRLFVDELGFKHSCKVLGVHASTMRRWLRDDGDAPQAAMQALYWLTHWGFSDAAAEVHWSHQFLLVKVRELEAALHYRAPEHYTAANEARYHALVAQHAKTPPGRPAARGIKRPNF